MDCICRYTEWDHFLSSVRNDSLLSFSPTSFCWLAFSSLLSSYPYPSPPHTMKSDSRRKEELVVPCNLHVRQQYYTKVRAFKSHQMSGKISLFSPFVAQFYSLFPLFIHPPPFVFSSLSSSSSSSFPPTDNPLQTCLSGAAAHLGPLCCSRLVIGAVVGPAHGTRGVLGVSLRVCLLLSGQGGNRKQKTRGERCTAEPSVKPGHQEIKTRRMWHWNSRLLTRQIPLWDKPGSVCMCLTCLKIKI